MKRTLLFIICGTISLLAIIDSCQNDQQLKYEQYYANGRRLYQQHCQNCHAADGAGLGALIPPLTDSVFLRKNRSQLACLLKNGTKGKMMINGREYDGEMPANAALTPIDLAELVTYISNSFGHKQGVYDVSAAMKDCSN